MAKSRIYHLVAWFLLASVVFHFVYQTTNNVNGKIYVGVHSTPRMDDGYIGCGVYSQAHAEGSRRFGLKSAFIDAVCKYGYTNFSRIVLSFHKNPKDAFWEERRIVDESFVKNDNTYNIRIGGFGGAKPDKMLPHYSEIVSLFLSGQSLVDIGKKYNIGKAYVRAILRRSGADLSGRKKQLPSEKKYGHLVSEIENKKLSGTPLSSICMEYGMDYKTAARITKNLPAPEQKYVAVSPKKDILFFDSPTAFCRCNSGLLPGGISNVLQGKVSHYKGWLFFLKKDWSGQTTKTTRKVERFKLPTPVVFEYATGEKVVVTHNLYGFCKKMGYCYENVLAIKNKRTKNNTYKKIKIYGQDC